MGWVVWVVGFPIESRRPLETLEVSVFFAGQTEGIGFWLLLRGTSTVLCQVS